MGPLRNVETHAIKIDGKTQRLNLISNLQRLC